MDLEWHTLTGFSKSSITSAVNPLRHEPRRRVTGCTHTGSKFPKSHPVLPLASLKLEPDSLELDQVSHSDVVVKRLPSSSQSRVVFTELPSIAFTEFCTGTPLGKPTLAPRCLCARSSPRNRSPHTHRGPVSRPRRHRARCSPPTLRAPLISIATPQPSVQFLGHLPISCVYFSSLPGPFAEHRRV